MKLNFFLKKLLKSDEKNADTIINVCSGCIQNLLTFLIGVAFFKSHPVLFGNLRNSDLRNPDYFHIFSLMNS
jgi:hypothetical protein